MTFEFRPTRANLVVGGSLLLVLLLALYVIVNFWLMRQDYAQEIDAIEPRMARLIGISQSQQALESAGVGAAELVAQVAYPADRDRAGTAAAMQQDVREAMIAAGLAISGSQILQSREGEGYERLRLEVTVEGNVNALDEALTSLASMEPMVLIESLEAKHARRSPRMSSRNNPPVYVGDPRRVSVQFQLFSLRLQD